jgi:2-polyprenyl-3-methyl-5-hydroxy-6-metoxy-1,4-benzoquinol methylase
MKMKKAEDNLTTQGYWENYYKDSSTEKKVIDRIGQTDDKYWNIFYKVAKIKNNNILEIGTYPGRYLAYLASKFNLAPTGIDYNSDSRKIEETMRIMDIKKYNYIQEDFFKVIPAEKFDLVFSMGFIEHFENFNEVMDKHVEFMNDGGALLIRVPNKKYFRKWYGMLVDYENLRIHNLKCMNFNVFTDFAQRNNLLIHTLNYEGGFAYPVHQDLNFIQKIIYHSVRRFSIILDPLVKKFPSKFYSNHIIAIFTKRS